MSIFGRLLPSLCSNIQRCCPLVPRSFHSLTAPVATDPSLPGGLFATFVRTNIRCHFPRPSERKRIKRHGWKHRMSTEAGRRILMRRILRGRHVYSH